MLINRTTGGTDLDKFLPVIAQQKSELGSVIAFSGAGAGAGSFGIDWGLAVDTALWLGQGVRMGMRIHDAVTNPAGKPEGLENLDRQDVGTIAQQLAVANPDRSGKSAGQWEQLLLGTGLGTGIDPSKACPTGYYMDPVSRACLPVAKAGFFEDIPTWGKIAIGGGLAFLVLRSGMLKGLAK